MSAAAAARRAALKHLAYSGVGMGAGLALWYGFHWNAGAYDPLHNPYVSSAAAAAAGSESPEASSGGGSGGSKDELQLVQVVFRHGARTPLGRQYWREMGPVWDVCGKAEWAGIVPVEVRRLGSEGWGGSVSTAEQRSGRLLFQLSGWRATHNMCFSHPLCGLHPCPR